ncbi:IgGFc-binding protein-like [Coturnix japonica]|uniref:IgGFc-binding protein-like n=1 Tax=Coturnix japonica TaxID=93934 RepID=UPI0013A5E779|nr:IgGFc-binding protein-like [Coturnix japonica]
MENERVMLHGVPISLPYTVKHPTLTVEQRGWEVELKTPWGLRVAYDGQHGRVSVQVESSYGGQLCGLCGDFDGDPRNDLMPARGWRVDEDEECEDRSGCGEEDGKKGENGEECGVLLDKDGPFRLCHEVVHPETYYRDCMADRCHSNGVCRVVAAYVAACQEVGKEVLEWRSQGFCAPNCPKGTRYALCTPNCAHECREGCVSPHDPQSGGKKCGAASTPVTSGTCRAVGTHHYLSFDGAAVTVRDNCTYVVARSCSEDGAHPPFEVTATDPQGGVRNRSVVVAVHGHRFVMSAGKHVVVDSSAVPLPFCLPHRAACLAHKAATILLVTDFGLRVTVGPGDMLSVTVPSSYHNSTCGLCGNFDGRHHNDHLHRNDVATCHRLCPGPKCPPCRQPPKNEYIHSKLCNVLKDPQGPFGVCHDVVRPGIYFEICLWELCESPGDRDALGEVLAAYDAACRQAKIRVGPWRIPRTCRNLLGVLQPLLSPNLPLPINPPLL